MTNLHLSLRRGFNVEITTLASMYESSILTSQIECDATVQGRGASEAALHYTPTSDQLLTRPEYQKANGSN
jgi:hypothetical protein